jgi:hypothetical protein
MILFLHEPLTQEMAFCAATIYNYKHRRVRFTHRKHTALAKDFQPPCTQRSLPSSYMKQLTCRLSLNLV